MIFYMIFFRLHSVSSCSDLRQLILDTLKADPRSSYRRNACPDLLHHFSVDCAKVTAVFCEEGTVEVLRVVPSNQWVSIWSFWFL